MKYKENKLAIYSILAVFALAGFLFTTQIVSLNSLHIWPLFQLIGLFAITALAKKYFLTNSIVSGILLFVFFIAVMDLTNLFPALAFLFAALIHKLTGIGSSIEYETFFHLKPIFYILISFPFYKSLTLMANAILKTKQEDIFISNEKNVLREIPSSNGNKEYDLIVAGSIVYTKASETITIEAINLENFIDFTFVLKDKRNSILGLREGKNIISAKNCYISTDGNYLYIENSIKKLLKKEEVFTYVLYLAELPETFKTKIYQYLRFEVNANNEPINNNQEVQKNIESDMVNEAVTIKEIESPN